MKKDILCIGLMSGTSLDGCDAALVKITSEEKFILLDFLTLPYTDEFRNKIKRNLSDDTAKLSEVCSLNFELGYIFKDAIDLILKNNNLKYDDIEFVASHGQTIWHAPKAINGNVASTLQIGEGQVISVLTGIKVISNFRVADVVVGGEGAPLVPMFEYMYFKDDNKNVILQNIGGIGNLTYLKKGCNLNDVVAFDTGPGNVIIDYFVNKYFNKQYDANGDIANSGDIIYPVLKDLLDDEFLKRIPPKSTGREQYSSEFLEGFAKEHQFDMYNKEDIITTVSEFTVLSIVYNYKEFIKDFDKVIVSGGGAHNKYIMRRLNEELNNIVYRCDEVGLNSDAKEAFAFAVLGYLSLTNRFGNVRKATGAMSDVVLGEVTLGIKCEE